MSKYKVIKQVKPKRRRNDVPVDAVQLAEDIQSLETARKLLQKVNPWNITETDTQEKRDFGYAMQRVTIATILSWERYARVKLRSQYLAP